MLYFNIQILVYVTDQGKRFNPGPPHDLQDVFAVHEGKNDKSRKLKA